MIKLSYAARNFGPRLGTIKTNIQFDNCPKSYRFYQRWIFSPIPICCQMQAQGQGQDRPYSNNVPRPPYANQIPSWIQVRCYNRRRSVKIPVQKPPRFDYSGDLDYALPEIDLSDKRAPYRDIPELDSASDEVKRLFSLAFSNRNEILKMRLEDVLKNVMEHPADTDSYEYKIARFTVLIRNQIQHMANGNHKDKLSKSLLIRRIQARKKFMRKLRSKDIEKFDWLCKELKIKYVLPPHIVYNKRKESKKGRRKRIAREGCLDAKAEKMKLFKEKLEEEKKSFLQQKEVDLHDIVKDLKELGIEDDMTNLNDLLVKLNVQEFLPPKPDTRPMRQKLLEKKFELYGKNKKKGAAYRQKVIVT